MSKWIQLPDVSPDGFITLVKAGKKGKTQHMKRLRLIAVGNVPNRADRRS